MREKIEADEFVLRRSGSEIRFWLSGPEDAPLVAMSHGATMDHGMFDSQVPALVGAGYRTLTWDMRGHGRSKPLGDEFTNESAADDLAALVSEAGRESAFFLGQSLGGYVTQELYLRRPEIVSGIALIGSPPITVLPSRLERLALKSSPFILKLTPDRTRIKMTANSTSVVPEVREYARHAAGHLSKDEFLDVWRGVAKIFRDVPGHRVEVPLLLTHGEHDGTGNIKKSVPAWAERDPEARYRVIPDAGHNANQDNPEYFNRVLLEFLGDVSFSG